MIMEWLLGWVAKNAAGLLFKTILNEDFAKDLAKDYAKDFLKDRFNNVATALFKKEPLQKAIVMALKEFLLLVQEELKFRKLSEEEIKTYTKPLKTFIYDKSVKEILGKAFDADCDSLDYKTLENTWQSISLLPMPAKFNWQLVTDNYLRKVQQILFDSDELQNILILQKLDAIQQNDKDRSVIIPFDLKKYQAAIEERYGNLKLDSLDTSGYAYNELKLWRMFIEQNVREVDEVLPQVHELPKEHQRRLRESHQLQAEISLEELERYKQIYFQQPISPVVKLINNKQSYKHLVILGDPGSGKSTLLQYLALNWAESPLDNVISLPIPLLIELRTYVRNRDEGHCKNFLEFFHSGSAICHLNQHQLDKQLKAGNALVMFDGLDEVFEPGKREDVITEIHRFTNDYPDVQVIVTSRVIGYKQQRLRDAGFSDFILQDLESEQIQEFMYRWHELTFNNEAEKVRKRERLQKAIENSSAIRELAGNPLLLTMMAILNRNQELPRDRTELYNQASRVLLHQWDVERALVEDTRLDPKTIDYKDKQAMLRQVAYHMQANEKGLAGNLISADDLERILTDYLKSIEFENPRQVARVMINQLRTRNFILCFAGADYYAFVHRTFLEYFCAWEFVWQFEKERKITLDDLKTQVFGKHWQDESWHEVLRLIAGMIDAKFTGEIIDYLMSQDGEAQKFSNLFLAAKCLSEVRNRSVITSTDSKLLDCLKALTQYKGNKDASNAEEFDLIRKICTLAVSAIAITWKGNPKTLPFLKTVADSTRYWAVQQAVVEELVKEIVANETNPLPILKMHAQFDNDSDLRIGAIQELARRWKEDPDTLAIIKDRVQIDNDLDVRRIALHALAQGWKEDIDTLSILKSRAQSDNAWQVRRAAVLELGRRWKDEPGMFEFLCDRAVSDPCKTQLYWLNPRKIALAAIIEQYPEHPQTLQLLRDRAENDPDEKLREFAKKKLRKRGVTM